MTFNMNDEKRMLVKWYESQVAMAEFAKDERRVLYGMSFSEWLASQEAWSLYRKWKRGELS